jgi:hypothetical protein
VQVRDVTLGKRDDAQASEGEALEEPRGVLLVPRLNRSSASARTMSNRAFNASRINAWKPERSSVAPEIA